MKKQLYKVFDWASSQPSSHININESKSVSHFNWFARYNVTHDEKFSSKAKE